MIVVQLPVPVLYRLLLQITGQFLLFSYIQSNLSFDKTFGNHHIGATAVYEYQGQKLRNENASGNQASNDLKTLNNASNVSVQTLKYNLNILSYIGRLTYDYKGKYLLNGAIRRDGGSYWAPGNKWQTFPSASIGWRIDQENFMKNQTKISELKLRAGYGVTGLNGTALGGYSMVSKR